MNVVLQNQLSLDYCCTPEEVLDSHNHFTGHRFLEGRRRFEETGECVLKLALVNGKLLFTGREDIISWCREEFGNEGAEWFMEPPVVRKLNDRLYQEGYCIVKAHPFFISGEVTEVDAGDYDIRWYRGSEIEEFRGDERFGKAYSFCETAPDVIGVGAFREGRVLGMAGASADSPTMWQIGINVEPEYRGLHLGEILVTLLKNEILKEGALPYYGTAFSHLASQRIALASGFRPAWVELETGSIER